MRKFYSRSLYIRKDGTLYVQTGHDRVAKEFTQTQGETVSIQLPSSAVIVGTHINTKKCGIVLKDWQITR